MDGQLHAWAQTRRDDTGASYWIIWGSDPAQRGRAVCWGAYYDRRAVGWTLDALSRHGYDVSPMRED